MKKNIVFFLSLFFIIAVLFACEKTTEQKKPAATKATESNAKEENNVEKVSDSDATQYAEKILKDMSLDEKIGQMMMVGLDTLCEDAKNVPKATAKPSKKKKKKSQKKKTKKKTTTKSKSKEDIYKLQLKKYPVGGILLTADDMKDKEQTIQLTQLLQEDTYYYPMYIATMEEWGDKSIFATNDKLEGTVYPMLSEVATTKSLDDVYQMGKTTGTELRELGINMNLAPVADVSDGLKNAQYAKYCYSDDEGEVSDYITNAVQGMRQAGICTTLTHFPGVGSIGDDYKKNVLDNDSGLTHLRDVDFVPFSAGIDAGSDAVMVTHVSVSKVTQNKTPASMSELVVTGILRDELGFEGLILTDELNMPCITERYQPERAVLLAIQAGVDIVVEPENLQRAFSSVREAVANRSLDEKALNEAVIRILKNKIQRGVIEIDQTVNE